MLPVGRVLVARNHDREVGLGRRQEPAFLRWPLVQLWIDGPHQLAEVLVPETSPTVRGRSPPHGKDDLLEGPEGLVLRDARIDDTPHPPRENVGIVLLAEVAVVGEVRVGIVGDKAEERLFQVRPRHRESVDEPGPNRWRQGDADPGGRHDPGHRPEHLSAILHVPPVGKEGIARRPGIEVLVVPEHEVEQWQLIGGHPGSRVSIRTDRTCYSPFERLTRPSGMSRRPRVGFLCSDDEGHATRRCRLNHRCAPDDVTLASARTEDSCWSALASL